MQKINYQTTKEYWNENLNDKKITKYASGFVMDPNFEEIAKYRYQKELNFLQQKGILHGNYLDLGCGTGNLLSEWHSKFDRLIGIDFSSHLVKVAKKQSSRYKNVAIFKDNILNYKKYTDKMKFDFIFIGGCLMYLNDKDVQELLNSLVKSLNKGGVLIYRESVTDKRIYQDYAIRRTIDEYTKLTPVTKDKISTYENTWINYTYYLMLYQKLIPYFKNNLSLITNRFMEYLLLQIPLRIVNTFKKNPIRYYFFVIKAEK